MSRSENNPWLHGFAVLTAISTLVLLGVGGLVTSHGVGMAVPDWPTTYGHHMFFFPFSYWRIGGIFYEHTHRLVASAVGLMTGILALWMYGRAARGFLRWMGLLLLVIGIAVIVFTPAYDSDGIVAALVGVSAVAASFMWPRCGPATKVLRRLAIIAFALVVVQGVLGGLRVTMFKDELGIFHGTLAQLFFVLICAIALLTSRWWQRPADVSQIRKRAGLRWIFLGTTALILFQLMLGATMRHQHAGLAIPDFPLAYGKLWPAMDAGSVMLYNQQRFEVITANPITAFQIGLQMVHRIVAALILIAVAWCARAAVRRLGWQDPLAKVAVIWLGLIFVQAGLGAWTIWSDKAADVATAHVVVGALSLVTGALLSIICFRSPESVRNGIAVQQPTIPLFAPDTGGATAKT
jgi:heme a synthase